jgi:hypothetical protein
MWLFGARPRLAVAHLLARRPPLCDRVGAEIRRVLLQTLEAWSADAVMPGPRPRPTRGTAEPHSALTQPTERSSR